MNKFFCIVNIIVLFLLPVIFHVNVSAQIRVNSPPYVTGTQKQASLNFIENLLQFLLNANSAPTPDIIIPTISNQLFSPNGLIYYPQCDQAGKNTSLPLGCTLCQAGCGPTTVAMILSSYISRQFTPQSVVEIYAQNGLDLGCDGSYISHAKLILEKYGLKTTDLLFYPRVSADDPDLISDFQSYIKLGGWTFVVLGDFADPDPNCNLCHLFWVVDIDSQNNILAYDPYYGMYEIPYNENKRFPLPKYKIAFGVKKI